MDETRSYSRKSPILEPLLHQYTNANVRCQHNVTNESHKRTAIVFRDGDDVVQVTTGTTQIQRWKCLNVLDLFVDHGHLNAAGYLGQVLAQELVLFMVIVEV